MTNRYHNTNTAWHFLLLLIGAWGLVVPTTTANACQSIQDIADTSTVQPADTAMGLTPAQKEYLDLKKAETIQVMDAGQGNYILLATAAWEHNRSKVEHIFWVPHDIGRYGRVSKEIRDRRTDPRAHLAGIPVRKLILHAPRSSASFFSIAISDDLVLADGEAYDSKNTAHQGQPLYTVWEEHRISKEAGYWLRLLIDNQLSTLSYQGPTIPMENTHSANLQKPKRMNGATEEEWCNAVMPEER